MEYFLSVRGEHSISIFLQSHLLRSFNGVFSHLKEALRAGSRIWLKLFIHSSGVTHHYRLQFVPVTLHYDFMYLTIPRWSEDFSFSRTRLQFAQYTIPTRASIPFGFTVLSILFHFRFRICRTALVSSQKNPQYKWVKSCVLKIKVSTYHLRTRSWALAPRGNLRVRGLQGGSLKSSEFPSSFSSIAPIPHIFDPKHSAVHFNQVRTPPDSQTLAIFRCRPVARLYSDLRAADALVCGSAADDVIGAGACARLNFGYGRAK